MRVAIPTIAIAGVGEESTYAGETGDAAPPRIAGARTWAFGRGTKYLKNHVKLVERRRHH